MYFNSLLLTRAAVVLWFSSRALAAVDSFNCSSDQSGFNLQACAEAATLGVENQSDCDGSTTIGGTTNTQSSFCNFEMSNIYAITILQQTKLMTDIQQLLQKCGGFGTATATDSYNLTLSPVSQSGVERRTTPHVDSLGKRTVCRNPGVSFSRGLLCLMKRITGAGAGQTPRYVLLAGQATSLAEELATTIFTNDGNGFITTVENAGLSLSVTLQDETGQNFAALRSTYQSSIAFATDLITFINDASGESVVQQVFHVAENTDQEGVLAKLTVTVL